ncbi:hypothetical protein, partial [Pseudomonas aeruginosa]|uniref:hypothetical protein n=1 Tax=Pseudomonas aeruginosa TaxID=287 RepID=UPI001ED95834
RRDLDRGKSIFSTAPVTVNPTIPDSSMVLPYNRMIPNKFTEIISVNCSGDNRQARRQWK